MTTRFYVGLFVALVITSGSEAHAQLGGSGNNEISNVSVTDHEFVASAPVNGISQLITSASFRAHWANNETEDSSVYSDLHVTGPEPEFAIYFEMDHEFVIEPGQTVTWELECDQASTNVSGTYTSNAFIDGCNSFDESELTQLVFDE
jgi:hypothetical protein